MFMQGVPVDIYLVDRLRMPLREIHAMPNRVVMELLALARLQNELNAPGR